MVRSISDNGSSSVPPFLRKCYEMVDDESTNNIISWSNNNGSFVIWDMTEFTIQLLPNYFKHSNFSSFIRQLNIYGFKKIDTDSWEFANEGFIRGQKNLLKNIARRKNSQSSEQKLSAQQQDKKSVETVQKDENSEHTELWKDVENLKIDKEEVVQELGKLRKHQETVDGKMLRLRDRVGGMEKNQQQMLSFLVMAMQNPGILAQFIPKEKNNNWRVSEAGSMLEQGTENNSNNNTEANNSGMLVTYQPSNEPTPVVCSEKPQESDQIFDGMKDFVMDIDFMKLLMDENLNPFIPPDLPLPDDRLDSAWENLLLASPFRETVKEDGQGSSDSRTQLEKSQSFKFLLDQIENPQDFGMQPTRTSQSLYSDYPTE